jgi:WD40 repeat protein
MKNILKRILCLAPCVSLVFLLSAGTAAGQKPELVLQTGHASWIYSVTFSPDGKLLASGGLDLTIKIWEVSTGTLLRSLIGHSNSITSVAFSPDGKL